MKPRRIIIASIGIVVAAGVVWLLAHRNPSTPTKPVSRATSAQTADDAFPTPIVSAAPRQSPGGPYAPADPRWPERTRRLKADPQYEWKTPIEFYGKVIDQGGKPVEGVVVSMDWTDMSPTGSSEAERTTDSAGLFSITGIQGKNFGVRSLVKNEYVPFEQSNPHSFEYAGFWEPSYHVPDKGNPVIFRLRKIGEAAPLVTSEGKFVLTFGTAFSIPMPQAARGAVSPIEVTVFENDGKTRTWKAQVTVEGGGIKPALEEFPFQAPEQGYQTSIDLDQGSPRPPGWQDLDVGGWFYIKTDQGYGLLKLRQIRGKNTLHYEVLVNSKGGTNLEPAQP